MSPDINTPTTPEAQQVVDELEWARDLAAPRGLTVEAVLLAELLVSLKVYIRDYA